jgi:arylsulfatase A
MHAHHGLVCISIVICLAFPISGVAEDSTKTRPNIVLLLVDDMGYECLGANGSKTFQTPVVDRLAASGVRFEHAFVQPNCTPTRVALLTGKVNKRNYVHFGLLENSERTFGNLFRDAGYSTCVVGKWQLGGSVADETPKHFGFDEHCLYHIKGVPKQKKHEERSYSSRYVNPGLVINGEARQFGDNKYAPDICNDFAIDYISHHRNQPFLLFYPMMLTHAPFDPTPDSSDYPGKDGPRRTSSQHYQDMVAYNDKLIGKLLSKLDELDLTRQTLIIFLGDNGTPGGFVSRMTDGESVDAGKGETTRAGMHVPLVVSWRGKIEPNQVCHDLIDSTDLLPTICEAAGINIPSDWPLDGRSFLPQTRGEKGNPREWIYSWFNPLMAKWDETVEMAFTKDFKLYRTGEFYDWRVDPTERHPLNPSLLDADAKVEWTKLHAAIESFGDVRPARIEQVANALREKDASEKGHRRRSRRVD